ncbi:MAG: dual specificity protein phosphatase family protein [Planctomycetes bacterium]|nr:dual specificity protein phosphatase family protein [Planctomycetota bacterium]
MLKYLRLPFAFLVLAVMIGGPLWYYGYRSRSFRNFHVVEEGVLYRSGQLTTFELEKLVREYGIKTVVSLRDGDKATDRREEDYLRWRRVQFTRIPPLKWWAVEGPAPVEEGLAVFREIMGDPSNYPVLVHCFAGLHRTGAYCAVFRIDFHHWSNADAMKEMRNLGYRIIDDHADVYGFLTSYQPPAP